MTYDNSTWVVLYSGVLALIDGHLVCLVETLTNLSKLSDGTLYDKPLYDSDKITEQVEELPPTKD
jgi:hypothetical protein